VKASTRTPKSRPAKRPRAKVSAGRASSRSPAAKRAKPAARADKATAKRASKRPRRATRATARAPARRASVRARGRWLAFVERHGVVLASAHGPVPCVADAVAGQPIVGSWWAHPRGKAIFAALSEIDDSDDVRCFKLVNGKVTFVHRRMWPALARLASDGMIAAPRVASIQQEHMPTGQHRNIVTPFPAWVPDDVARAASTLTVEAARAQLGSWV
jgi:hypothetical protein